MPAVGERRAERGRRRIADAHAAAVADELVRLIHGPQPLRPVAHLCSRRRERPVLVLDLRVELRAQPRRRNRARVPAVGRVEARTLEIGAMGAGELLAARLIGRLLLAVDELPHGLDELRHGRLGVRGDGKIDVGEALEVLVVRADVEVARADADRLRVRLGDVAGGPLDTVLE